MNRLQHLLIAALLLTSLSTCGEQTSDQRPAKDPLDIYEQSLLDIQYLASDELRGRRTGTEGNRLAQIYIENRFKQEGLQMFGDSYRHPFDHSVESDQDEQTEAVNLIGYVEGTENPDRYLVVTAHYDHLGVQDGEIYNGADDNASGTAGLMAAAGYFTENRPENSIIFIAFDAEEQGLAGAHHFVGEPVVPLSKIVMNVNMDMISTNDKNELYAVGTYHYPFLKPVIQELTASARVEVLFGYDSDEWEQDWTMASDHGPFHQQGVPFIYFGVEDHPHYHAPTDDFSTINQDFFQGAVAAIINVIEGLDERLDDVKEKASAE
ncbi:MAG: M28 family peptidase [Bacteroidetes bacterium]|jgi:hypothetical protein|nr:M28 family peptidase [Bacteroidota bacterium]